MNYSLIIIFCCLIVNFAIIVSMFAVPLFGKGFFVWIGTFFVLGLALVVMAIRKRVERMLNFFLILTGASAAGFVASVLLHNFIYGLFIYLFGPEFWINIGIGDEPVFFFTAILICPIAFIIGLVGSLVMLIKGARK